MQPQVHRLIRIRDDAGNMSIDFLVGFTIFLLAFIWVATMIPGLLIGLQSYTIDYDAVAYRTGVLLVEDPGWPAIPGWETYNDQQKYNMTRFGLAISKDTPNILSDNKINRFFNKTTFTYPEDYQTRVIFGDYPYQFNVSVRDIERDETRTVGDIRPSGYGHIHRLVKIKSMSNTTINQTYIVTHQYINNDTNIESNNVTRHEFSILLNNPKLLSDVRDPRYQIDTATDQIMVNITDLHSTLFYNPFVVDYHIPPDQVNITLKEISVYKADAGTLTKLGTYDYPYIDDNSSFTQPPIEVKNSVSMKITPDFIAGMQAQYTSLYFNLTFDLTTGGPSYNAGSSAYRSTFLNNTNAKAPPFDYNYDPANVTQPRLRDGIVEVSVW
jgi:hypothetical protein